MKLPRFGEDRFDVLIGTLDMGHGPQIIVTVASLVGQSLYFQKCLHQRNSIAESRTAKTTNDSCRPDNNGRLRSNTRKNIWIDRSEVSLIYLRLHCPPSNSRATDVLVIRK